VKVGDLIRFTKSHWQKPGIDYVEDWVGVVVETVTNSTGVLEELHIIWNHGGKISDYSSSWWNRLLYEPFEVISENVENI
jgi:hypothetical protein